MPAIWIFVTRDNATEPCLKGASRSCKYSKCVTSTELLLLIFWKVLYTGKNGCGWTCRVHVPPFVKHLSNFHQKSNAEAVPHRTTLTLWAPEGTVESGRGRGHWPLAILHYSFRKSIMLTPPSQLTVLPVELSDHSENRRAERGLDGGKGWPHDHAARGGRFDNPSRVRRIPALDSSHWTFTTLKDSKWNLK